jgi:hypothetical protein
MMTHLPANTLTWGTASTAVASALVLACVGCLVPTAQRSAAPGQQLRVGAMSGQVGGAMLPGPSGRQGDPAGALSH